MSTRREFIRHSTFIAAAGLLPARHLFSQIVPVYTFASKKLPVPPGAAGDILVIGGIDDGGNVLILPSEKGTIVVDAKHAYSGEMLLKDVQTHINGNPGLLISTHHHLDHTGGNWAFKPTAQIVAQEGIIPRLRTNLPRYVEEAFTNYKRRRSNNPNDPGLPAAAALADKLKTLTIDDFAPTTQVHSSESMNFGGIEIELRHFGNGHTDNDLVVYFPKLNMLHAGDLLFNKLHPFVDRNARGNTGGWQNSLRRTIELCNDETIVIPGHGEIGNKASLQAQIDYFDVMRAAVDQAIKEGKSKEGILNINPEQFTKYGFEGLRPVTLGAIYDEQTGAKN